MDKRHANAAAVHKALGNPTRVAMLYILRDEEVSRDDLFRRMHINGATFAQHLARLRKAGLVKTRRAGKEMRYHLANPQVLKLCDEAEKVYRRSYEL